MLNMKRMAQFTFHGSKEVGYRLECKIKKEMKLK